MKQLLTTSTEFAVMLIDAIALLVIVFGTIEATVRVARAMLDQPSGQERRDVWLRYARWLVAGLTFQLAADIIETSISTNWQTIGRVAATAVIRTFLNYFLERDVEQQQRACAAEPPQGS